MGKKVHIVIAEPSVIIRSGVLSVIQKTNIPNIVFAEISDMSTLKEELLSLDADILIINPIHCGLDFPSQVKEDNVKILALETMLNNPSVLSLYDGVISIFDSIEKVADTLRQVIISEDAEAEKKAELSSREKEIVVCVSQGMTNKEIADSLFLSTHTVIAHRRNIASKLEIHSSSGLTIYAIVNKLIDIDGLPIK